MSKLKRDDVLFICLGKDDKVSLVDKSESFRERVVLVDPVKRLRLSSGCVWYTSSTFVKPPSRVTADCSFIDSCLALSPNDS